MSDLKSHREFLIRELEQLKQEAEQQRKQDKILSITLCAVLIPVAILFILTILILIMHS